MLSQNKVYCAAYCTTMYSPVCTLLQKPSTFAANWPYHAVLLAGAPHLVKTPENLDKYIRCIIRLICLVTAVICFNSFSFHAHPTLHLYSCKTTPNKGTAAMHIYTKVAQKFQKLESEILTHPKSCVTLYI